MYTRNLGTPAANDMDAAPLEDTSALNQVKSPVRARRAARLLLFLFLATTLALVFVPWQQFLTAYGRVTAYDPTLREQVVEAPVTGRIIKVHVVEGQEVKGKKVDQNGQVIPGHEGTLLVSIRDPDPDLMTRLEEQRDALEQKLVAAQQQVASFTKQVEALTNSQQQALKVAGQQIKIAQKKEKAAEKLVEIAQVAYDFADYQFNQQKNLLKEDLTSELEYQQSRKELLSAKAEKSRANLALLEAGLSILKFQSDADKVRFDFDASIRSASASQQKAQAEVASIKASLADLNVKIARQGAQDVYAPCDGTVFRIITRGSGGGMLVSAGTPLMRVVPEIPEDQRVVELLVDGNDAPLILELWQEQLRKTGKKPTIRVRLQFEGYPAIQWMGWPSAAVGTFGGIIDFVDQTDDGNGNFRVLVRRDPEEEATNPWPKGYALRQGLRVGGWVLLNRVTLGWELWRRLNGFPPVVAENPYDAGDKSKPAVIEGVKGP